MAGKWTPKVITETSPLEYLNNAVNGVTFSSKNLAKKRRFSSVPLGNAILIKT
jgi:hypothetical protein